MNSTTITNEKADEILKAIAGINKRLDAIAPRETPQLPAVMTTEEVAEILRLKVQTVQDMARAGRIKRLRGFKNPFRFCASEVRKVMTKSE